MLDISDRSKRTESSVTSLQSSSEKVIKYLWLVSVTTSHLQIFIYGRNIGRVVHNPDAPYLDKTTTISE